MSRVRHVRTRTLAPALLFDHKKRLQQLAGRQRGVAHRGGVQEERLRPGQADGNGFVVRRDAEVAEEGLQPGGREVEMRAPVAEIAPQPDGRLDQIAQRPDYPVTTFIVAAPIRSSAPP